MLSASRRASASPALQRVVVRTAKRRLATAAESPTAAETVINPPLPPKKRAGFIRRTIILTTISGLTYYGGSTVIALNSDRYRDFFVESVPLGEAIIDYAEHNSWDKIQLTGLPKQGFEATKGVYRTVKGAVSRTIGISSYDSSPESPDVPKPSAGPVYPRKPTRPPVTFTQAEKKELDKPSPPNLHQEASSNSKPEINSIKPKGLQISKENEKLVAEVERILFEGKPISPSTPSSSSGDPPQSEKNVYSAPLPLGFEPPPGYTRPSSSKSTESVKSKNPEAAPSSTLPLISPAVKELAASEPVLAQIASSIDHLASLLRNSPSAPTSTSSPSEGAKDILDTAKADLVALGSRIEALKKEEQVKLEKKLKKQTDEYTSKLLQLEMDLQDKIDRQEEGFRALLEEERREIVSTYREKLAAELETQSEIINQRLREEVIAQGIEIQRRWIREIKVRVEEERGGRLSKLDSLATGLKKLERVTLDNSSYLDENLRLHTLNSALRALSSAVDGSVRKPFREELRVLKNVSAVRDSAGGDAIIAAVLEGLDKSDVPDVGIEPIGDLIAWFTTSVAPRVESVALVPDQNAGVLSHLASSILSMFRFKRSGPVEGSDVSSVLARAEYLLVSEKDLGSAARELNQLKGVPRVLLSDWLAASRKRLEVEQALEVVRSQATLLSLLVV